ncbi:MAG: hypothetical protein IPK93_01970 [Solirubrobacterales bacterium]|nr:hypothetical protein [Solirubrobacterales bacterium]
MTEREAKARCAMLTAESPERTTHSWIPREGADGSWVIVKLSVPSASQATGTATAAEPHGIREDPRTPQEQKIPNNMAGF